MRGDFSRIRFSPSKHYTSVFQQQGRVALDADSNEQCAINEYIRTVETRDIVGPYGGPQDHDGFDISLDSTTNPQRILIGAGRYYVNGILCENEQDGLEYTEQKFLIDPDPTDAELLTELSQGASRSISSIQVYLQVWQRLVTSLDDPCLREPALGLADTTARLQTVWRVIAQGVAPSSPPEPPSSFRVGQIFKSAAFTGAFARSALAEGAPSAPLGFAGFSRPEISPGIPIRRPFPSPQPVQQDCCAEMYQAPAQEGTRGTLTAWTSEGVGDCSCQPTPAAGYRGLENQLYRVEIHQSGDESTATFKWSRENGSVVVAVTGGVPGAKIQVNSLGPDPNLGFSVGQWVEITDDTNLFGQSPNRPGQLYQIAAISPENLAITLQQVVGGVDTTKNARLRRWDQVQFATSTGVPLNTGDPGIPLENGIQVQFAPGQYNAGDYWLIPARTATGQIEWPPNDPCDANVFRPPNCIEVFSAPLACIEWQNGEFVVHDCRNPFDNLVALTKRPLGCCTVVASPQDLNGRATLQSLIDQAATPTMFVQAVSPGVSGNSITVQISNVAQNSRTPTFDLTVQETAAYRGLTTGGATGIEGVIGDEETNLPNTGPLAHILVGSVNTNGTPEDGQAVTLSGGGTGAAQGDMMDSNKQRVFTLQARSSGADGNLTRAIISNLDTTQSPPTFDLSLEWTKTLRSLSMTTLFQQIQDNLNYEIVAQAPSAVLAVLPAEGVTALKGGAEGNPYTGSSAVPAQAGIFGNPGKVCLQPGTYELSAPLTLGREHSNITIESCGGGPAILSGVRGWGAGGDLPQGLVVLNSADNVTLRGLCFSMPPPMRLVAGSTFLEGLNSELLEGILGSTVPGGSKQVARLLGRLYVSVGLRPVQCSNLRLENCSFDSQRKVGVTVQGALLEAGILASGANFGLTLLDNCFRGQPNPISISDSFLQISVGYLLAPSVVLSKLSRLAESFMVVKGGKREPQPNVHEQGTILPALLQDASFRGNTFTGLEAPVLIFSECGAMALEDNTVRDCYSGPWIVARRSPPDVTKVTGGSEPAGDTLQDPVFEGALALAQCYPLPQGFTSYRDVTVPAANIVLSKPPFQNPILAFLDTLLQLEFGLGQQALQTRPKSEPNLYFHGINNKIATYAPPAWVDSTGPGWVIWGEEDDQSAEVIVNSNRIENSSAPVTPTAVIVQVQNCAMTGNLIFNDFNSTESGSLYLAPLPPALSPSIVVTGNLFNSNTNLSSLVSPAAQTVGSGNGTNTLFNSTLAQHPIQPNSVKVYSGTSQVGTDNGAGTITGSAGSGLTGTIDYQSGACSLTFRSAPAAGTAVTISYLYSKWVPLNGP